MHSRHRGVVWRDLDEIPAGVTCVATLGVFDGFHRGHRALLVAAEQHAGRDKVPVVLVTFDPHPRVILSGGGPRLLLTLDERIDLAHAFGAAAVLVLTFDASFAATPPDEFVRDVLVRRLNATAVVVGENYRFGAQGRGTTDALRQLGSQLGFETVTVPSIVDGGRRCSSTDLRRFLADGDADAAEAMLGRPLAHLRSLPT